MKTYSDMRKIWNLRKIENLLKLQVKKKIDNKNIKYLGNLRKKKLKFINYLVYKYFNNGISHLLSLENNSMYI